MTTPQRGGRGEALGAQHLLALAALGCVLRHQAIAGGLPWRAGEVAGQVVVDLAADRLLDLGERANVVAGDQGIVRVREVAGGGGEPGGVVGRVEAVALDGELGLGRVGAGGLERNAQPARGRAQLGFIIWCSGRAPCH